MAKRIEDSAQRLEEACTKVLESVRAQGRSVADVCAGAGSEFSIEVRDGEVDAVKEAGSQSIGLRVIHDGQVGLSYTSDLTADGLKRLVDDAIELAELAEPDPCAGLADPETLADGAADAALDLFGEPPEAAVVKAWALDADAAARAHDERILSTDGTGAGAYTGVFALGTTGGFLGSYARSTYQIVAAATAPDADDKKRNAYHWDVKRHVGELEAAETIGQRAAERVLERLGATKIATGRYPVVFHPDAGRRILGNLLGLVSGDAAYRRATYLAEREGTAVASDLVTVIDDPSIPRRIGSRPWDGEGARSQRNVVVKEGVLETLLLDHYSASKLGRRSTHSAARSPGGSPGVSSSNWILEPGEHSPEQIISELDAALYVDSLMGPGFNPVDGTYSQGAAGFFIEKGEVAFPVSELTISLHFDALLQSIDAVGNDQDWRSSFVVPHFRVPEMTVGGTG